MTPSQALDEVLARFHLHWRRKQQMFLKEVPDALDGVEIWRELWMLRQRFQPCAFFGFEIPGLTQEQGRK